MLGNGQVEKQNVLEEDVKKARLTINYLKRQNNNLKQKIDDDYRRYEKEKCDIEIGKGREISKQKKDNDKLKTELSVQKKEKVKLSDQFQKSLANWKSRVDCLEEELIQKENELSRLQLELQKQEAGKMTLIHYDKQLKQLTEHYTQLQNEMEAATERDKGGKISIIDQKQDVLMQCMTAHMDTAKQYQQENRNAFQQINARLDKLKASEEIKEQPTQEVDRTPSPHKPTNREQTKQERDKKTAKKTPFKFPKIPK